MAAAEERLLLRRPLPPSENYLKRKTRSEKPTSFRQTTTKATPNATPLYCSHNGDPHIYSLHPKGPPPLPMGKILRHTDINGPLAPPSEQSFTLDDFLLSTDHPHNKLLVRSNCMVSRENYLKMTSWFATHVPEQSSVHNIFLEIDQFASGVRKPHYQLLIEFQSMLRELALDDNQSDDVSVNEQLLANKEDLLIQRPSRHFCGEQRSSSPFDDTSADESIGPSEMAILQSMMNGGHYLSLKAHFLSELPSLIPLSATLTHLNLSFNCLSVFPLQVCQLVHLQELRLRNNPIREIPSAIRSLQYLKLFSIPFNLLSDLPPGLFELSMLEDLDISHNGLQWISRDIHQLKHLKRLNVQCNQLSGLPATVLALPLEHVLVDSNYFHQMLWKENTHNSPQMLSDLCCTVLYDSNKMKLPSPIQSLLERPSGRCDYCQGPVFGCGLRVIRSIKDIIYGVKHLPFIFQVCSTKCHHSVAKSTGQLKWTGDHIATVQYK